MSYNTVAQMANDYPLKQRIAACVALEGEPQPDLWAEQNRWHFAAAPGWDAAYAYAVTAHEQDPDYRPGKDEAVVTDGMILAAVQARLSKEPQSGA